MIGKFSLNNENKNYQSNFLFSCLCSIGILFQRVKFNEFHPWFLQALMSNQLNRHPISKNLTFPVSTPKITLFSFCFGMYSNTSFPLP